MTLTIHCDKGCGDMKYHVWFGPWEPLPRLIKRLKRDLLVLHDKYLHVKEPR